MNSAAFFTVALGTTVDLFYRRRLLESGHQVPAKGPVLLVANHPNAMIDPMIVQNTVVQQAGRRVRMLAKSTLWKMPFVSLLVKGMDSLPVYRPKDGSDPKQNAQTFEAVEAALVAGSAVLIFPEGISHDLPSVQPLKTGAARIALASYARGAEQLLIIPVGLSYADKLRFRSTAAVEVGAPIRVADFAVTTGVEEDERAAVRRLTGAITEGLHQITVNLESWEDLPVLEAIDALWRQQDPERTRRIKKLARGTSKLRQQDPAYFEDLRTRLSDYLLRLKRIGLRPQDIAEGAVAARRSPVRVGLFALRNLVAMVFAFPFAILGLVFWFIPFWTVHLIWFLWRAEQDVGATVKVLAALVLYPLYYVVALFLLSSHLGPLNLLFLALMTPGAGMMTRHFFRRRLFAVRQLLTFARKAARGQILEELVRERDAFCAEFDAVAQRVDA